MLRYSYLCFIIAVLSLSVSGCSSDGFHVEGKIAGAGRQNLRAVYYADGAMRMIPAMVENGSFAFDGRASEPALVELYTSDRTLVGRFVVKNGENIRCEFDRKNPWLMTIEGNELSGRWAEFLRDNARLLSEGSRADVNALVANYVERNSDDPLSSLLLLTLYDAGADPTGAAGLLAKTDPDSRPHSLLEGYEHLLAVVNDSLAAAPVGPMRVYSVHDSMMTFRPSKRGVTLISLSTAATGRSDSIVKRLKTLSEGGKSGSVSILDLSLDADTVAWRESIAADSARWTQAWAPGGLGAAAVEPLAVSRVPYFIVTDSAGCQLYRGGSLAAATSAVEKFLK